jgi:hypothetical protein
MQISIFSFNVESVNDVIFFRNCITHQRMKGLTFVLKKNS